MSLIEKIINKFKYVDTAQYVGVNVMLEDGFVTPDVIKSLCRRVAAEGCVLLKNDDNVLPIKNGQNVALFGRCQHQCFYTGYGSGGDVKYQGEVSPYQGLKNAGVALDERISSKYKLFCEANPQPANCWGTWPTFLEEMPLFEEDVLDAAKVSNLAIYIIGRASGEDRENVADAGSWYLTKTEYNQLSLIRKCFKKVAVVINCGSLMDLTFVNDLGIDALMLAYQGGQEYGNGLADVLTGRMSPSGKLTDTAAAIDAYPSTKGFGANGEVVYTEDIYVGYRYFETFKKDDVIYPFGFGLSYTTFNLTPSNLEMQEDSGIISVVVTNTGSYPGAQVVQLYVAPPQGALGKPARSLCAFAKTKLLNPGESDSVNLFFNISDFASYDDTGATGHVLSYIIEDGDYSFYLGTDVRSASLIKTIHLDQKVLGTTENVLREPRGFERMVNDGGRILLKEVKPGKDTLKQRIIENLPKEIEYPGFKDISFSDVKKGKYSLDDFVAQLSAEEMEALSRGDGRGMDSEYGPRGNASCMGGVTKALIEKGIPAASTNDGPSGIRLLSHCTLYPTGACIGATFNPALAQEIGKAIGWEVKLKKSHILLAPGLNIHRNPLCGRNFEYYSEDPLLTGKMASAYIKGVQSEGTSATPKHFAANNQESYRTTEDSLVSKRALREIYLKAFEIVVKEAKPDFIMTSYNKLNGIYSYYNYDLNTTVLRKEWGFEGVIMTDWWVKKGRMAHFPKIKNRAAGVRAGSNVLMPGSERFGVDHKLDKSFFKGLQKEGNETLTLAELQQNTKQILQYLLKL